MPNVVVLGTGMGGLGATHRLQVEGVRPAVYDKNAYYGGHTASFRDEAGFLFDIGPHISFTTDERIQQLFAQRVDGQYETLQVHLNNYWRGLWLTHPVQLHMHGLPHDVIIDVVADFVEEQHGPERPIANYEDWLIASYGKQFAQLFPMQYTRKYHTTSADNMTTDWLGPRMYRPSLQEMLRGALAPWSPGVHYVSNFRYPTEGGFLSYLRDFSALAELQLEHRLVAVDPGTRELRFANGVETTYDALVSSVPLPELIPLIAGVPADVLEASQKLACSTCVLVNLGVNRTDLSDAHMSYFYDEDVCFSRISFPHMLSATNAPPGTGSIQAEVYFSRKYRPLKGSPEDCIDVVIGDLQRCGVLREDDQILSRHVHKVDYANVIFDLDRPAALETVHGYLDDVGIAYCGRYGDWDYMWTDQSYISGEKAAERALANASQR